MKQLILLVSVLFLGGMLYAQQPAASPSVPVKNNDTGTGPVMTLESDVVDYGDAAFGSEPLRKIKFTNTGTEPLVITNAKGSCGCTVPTWPREPIMPGESGEIDVRYDTKRPGAINKTIKITTNEASSGQTVRVIGNIAPEVQQETLPKKEGIFNGGK